LGITWRKKKLDIEKNYPVEIKIVKK